MKENAMQIAFILDRSGSMGSIAEATVEGVNAFLEEQKNSPTETSIQFVQFDDLYEEIYDGKIDQVPFLSMAKPGTDQQRQFVPRGWTALLDAMGRAMTEMGERLSALSEEERQAKVVVVIMTDGQENSSKKYTRDQIATLIQQQRDVYKWEFQYLGANQDAIEVAAQYNIPRQNAVTYRASDAGTKNVMRAASNKIYSYGVTGQSLAMNFDDTDREAAMEFDKSTIIKP